MGYLIKLGLNRYECDFAPGALVCILIDGMLKGFL
jgi:hypothetical protein